jgi:hypothetical protein
VSPEPPVIDYGVPGTLTQGAEFPRKPGNRMMSPETRTESVRLISTNSSQSAFVPSRIAKCTAVPAIAKSEYVSADALIRNVLFCNQFGLGSTDAGPRNDQTRRCRTK